MKGASFPDGASARGSAHRDAAQFPEQEGKPSARTKGLYRRSQGVLPESFPPVFLGTVKSFQARPRMVRQSLSRRSTCRPSRTSLWSSVPNELAVGWFSLAAAIFLTLSSRNSFLRCAFFTGRASFFVPCSFARSAVDAVLGNAAHGDLYRVFNRPRHLNVSMVMLKSPWDGLLLSSCFWLFAHGLQPAFVRGRWWCMFCSA